MILRPNEFVQRCRMCKTWKSTLDESFAEGMKTAKFAKAECRQCSRLRHIARRDNPDTHKQDLAVIRNWQKSHKENVLAANMRWFFKNIEKVKEYRAIYLKKPEVIAARKAYYDNPEWKAKKKLYYEKRKAMKNGQ